MRSISYWSHTPSFRRDTSGSVAILAAICILVIMGVVGVAIDYGRASNSRAHLQLALDAAVLSAVTKSDGDVTAAVTTSFRQNFSQSRLGTVSLSVVRINASTIQATGTLSVKTTFLAALGFESLPVRSKSVASTRTVAAGNKACVMVLDPTASQAFLVNSGATVAAPDCEIHVKSTAGPAAIFNAGSNLTTARICIEGSSIIDNGGTHPNTQTGCTTVNDPYAGKLPTPNTSGCTFSNLNFTGGTVNLTPGVYCGWVNFNGAPTVNFAPGVYVIKGGGWNVNGGTWKGTDVTFYYADTSKIQFNSAVAAAITAPTSGTYQGLFMYEAQGLPRSPFVLDDSLGFQVTDLIYLPSRDTIFNASSNLNAKKFTLIVNTLILDQTNWQLQPGDKAVPISGGTQVPMLVR